MNNEVSGSGNPVSENAQALPSDELIIAGGNLPFAIAGGVVAALVGAAIWAVITVSTGYQIGFMAVGVGFLVGVSVKKFGKGDLPVYGFIGATLALAGCILGNFLSLVGFVSASADSGFFATLGVIDYAQVPSIMLETGSPMDLLFYGIAVYEGYKFSMYRSGA